VTVNHFLTHESVNLEQVINNTVKSLKGFTELDMETYLMLIIKEEKIRKKINIKRWSTFSMINLND
jgi:hypothetical protein